MTYTKKHIAFQYNIIKLDLGACVAAEKCRSVLYHCVIVFFWSPGIIDSMLFTFENRVQLMRASGMWHL